MKTRCPPRFEETFVQFPGQDTTRRWEGQYSGRYYGCPSPPLGRAIFESLLRLSCSPVGKGNIQGATTPVRSPVGKGNVQGATTPVRSPVGKGNIQGATTPLRSPRWEGQCSRRDDACPFARWEGQFRALLWLSVHPEGNRRGTGSPSPRSSKNLPLVGEVWGEGKESWTPRRYAALDAGDTGRSRTCE